MKKNRLMGLSILLAASSALAEQAAPAQGQATREALDLQRSGRAASSTARPMSDDVADRTHQRYAESFSHPIPESFAEEEQEFVQGSE